MKPGQLFRTPEFDFEAQTCWEAQREPAILKGWPLQT